MTGMIQDVRYAFRGLSRNPGFTITVVLSIGLGIGANLAVFSVVNAALFKDPLVRNPEQLARVVVFRRDSPRDLSYPMFRDLSAQQSVFSGMAASGGLDVDQVSIDGQPEEVDNFAAAMVSANYFSLLGVSAAVGRVFRQRPSHSPCSLRYSAR